MNDPNDKYRYSSHRRHLHSSQLSQRSASSQHHGTGTDSENRITGASHPSFDRRSSSSFTREQPIPALGYYHREIEGNKGPDVEILEPCPIIQMDVTNHISVQELLHRDPTTAKDLLELFRCAPTHTSRMMTSPYRTISAGYQNLKETKLEPSQITSLGGQALNEAIPSPRSARPKRESSCSNDSLPRDHPEQYQMEARRSEGNKLPSLSSFRSMTEVSSLTMVDSLGGDDEDDVDDGERPGKKSRYRALKSGQWFQRFHELVEYKERFGSCHVPHNWELNVPLAQWVKRQRYQYTLRDEGKHSTMTDERKRALDEIGFIWSSHGTTFSNRLEELQKFKKEFGHCNVPKNYRANKALAVWIKSQRRQVRPCLSTDLVPTHFVVL
jgi:hypothetical protein